MNLEQEAEKIFREPFKKNIPLDDIITSGTYAVECMIKLANSNFIRRQKIETAIWNLEELRNSETIYWIDPKIDELQEQLKKLEDGK